MSPVRATAIAALLSGMILPASASAPGRSERSPVVITPLQSLAFGQLISERGPGSVSVSPSGDRQLLRLGELSSAYGPAEFLIEGEPLAIVSIDLPAAVTLGPGARIERFKTGASSFVQLDGEGRAIVRVGATLVVDGAAAASSYRMEFTVHADYP